MLAFPTKFKQGTVIVARISRPTVRTRSSVRVRNELRPRDDDVNCLTVVRRMISHQLAEPLLVGLHGFDGEHIQDFRLDVVRVAAKGGIVLGEFREIGTESAVQDAERVPVVAPGAP